MTTTRTAALLAALLLGAAAHAVEYRHGLSYIEPLKYPPDFEHFEFVNPDAPKGGTLRLPQMGTFDNFNFISEKGRDAEGLDDLLHDRLMEESQDEPASWYGRLATGIAVDPDYRWVQFRLTEDARWHDGAPLTARDIVFTFDAMKEHSAVYYKSALLDLDHVEIVSDNEVRFVTREGRRRNPLLPFVYASFRIFPEHYWAERDFSKTTVEPPLGSGPYRIAEHDFGRSVTYERVDDYWGAGLPAMKGRFNFDRVKYDYFRDEHIMLEAHKADIIDVRQETVSKNWATQYNFPAVQAGLFKRELLYITRPWGLWWPTFWNMDRTRFQDARVREALWLLYDFPYINRVILFGFYDHGHSFFHNSKMAQSGLPSEDELELLEPFRDQLPERLFTEPFRAPPSTGFGYNRDNTERAIALFREAGWRIDDGVMRNVETGERFTVDFVFVAATTLRAYMPYLHALNRVGIETTGRAPENSNWLYRMRTGAFDSGVQVYLPANTPGFELESRFGSAAADADYSLNWPNIRDPVLDALIRKVQSADNARAFYAATRAFDRVLLWRFYFVPAMAQPGFRLVYWDKFGIPESGPLRHPQFTENWWWDEAKARHVADGIARLAAGASEGRTAGD